MRRSELEAAIKECSGFACATLVEDMVRDISSGTLSRNAKVPSEQELARQYGISVTAVRRGMEVMVREGFLSRRRGSGTYVNSAARTPTQDRADTIVICRVAIHTASHPYYGYIYPALYARLAKLGFRVQECEPDVDVSDTPSVDYHNIDPGQLTALMENDSAVAGLVLHRPSDEVTAVALQSSRPCVAVGQTPGLPFVDYDWDGEFIRAIGVALNAGARRVWAIDSMPYRDDAHATLAAKALAKGAGKAVVEIHHNPPSSVYSQIVYDACQATRAMLRADGAPFDGIVVASDFHAQGVLDALTEAGFTPDRCPTLVVLVNQKSLIHSNLPFTALVADGAATGRAVADLLQQQINSPRQAPAHVFLSCTLRAVAEGAPVLSKG